MPAPASAVDVRLTQRRDGSIRARVRGHGSHADLLRYHLGATLFGPVGGERQAEVTLEEDRLEWAIAQLAAAPDPLPAAAAELTETVTRWKARGVMRRPDAGTHVNDVDLRPLVHAWFEDATAIRVDELSLGLDRVRADVAVLTDDQWTGVEIKGQGDSLSRLPRQVVGYSNVFDRCVLVTTPNHLDRALTHVPDWWQVLVAVDGTLREVRGAEPNPGAAARARVELMWRDELVAALARHAPHVRASQHYVHGLRDELAAAWTADQARAGAMTAMRARHGWPASSRAAGFTRGRRPVSRTSAST